MDTPTTPFRHIRESIFGERLAGDFAQAIGISAAQQSRLESGHCELTMPVMQRVRALAAARSIAWDDRFFFEAPSAADLTSDHADDVAERRAAVACERSPVLQPAEGAGQ